MTINIEYETDKPLDVDYEKVANDIIPAALDYEKCPYEAEVNLILTDNDAIQEINRVPPDRSSDRCIIFSYD